MMEQNFDVYIIDLDGDQRYALELVEEISANPSVTVMVFSMNNDPNLLMSCMRSGAREFLSQPVALGPLNEALSRASSRRPATRVPSNKPGGRSWSFLVAKGARASPR
jgi:pilus assembly protein CpaE